MERKVHDRPLPRLLDPFHARGVFPIRRVRVDRPYFPNKPKPGPVYLGPVRRGRYVGVA